MILRALLCLSLMTAAHAQELPYVGLAHVAFRVSDVARFRAFYLDQLGFEEAFEFNDGGKTSVAFIKVNDRQYIELYARKAPADPVGFGHLAVETTDINRTFQRLVEKGLAPSKVNKGGAGNLVISVKDPDGQIVEFLQYLPDSLHVKGTGLALGAKRISERLLYAAVVATNLDRSLAFYRDKLDFAPLPGRPMQLRIPGARGDLIELIPNKRNSRPYIAFETSSPPAEFRDPDGNRILLTRHR
jgi:catechol 2,3-dioxygenase-like lactoylglutathione lyase family enzyme